MTVKLYVTTDDQDEIHETVMSQQQIASLMWKSREKWYCISRVTLTHNPEYPTPAISVTAPAPGIRFTVYDQEGEVVYTNKKQKEIK